MLKILLVLWIVVLFLCLLVIILDTKFKSNKNVEKEFIELIVEYPNVCQYPEVKYEIVPYYSIRYIENGIERIGYGTYNLKVLSSYLREYFM